MAGYTIGASLFLGLAAGAVLVVRQALRAYEGTAGSRDLVALDLVTSALLGLGILSVLAIPAFWWWVNGSRERYLWIVSGPPPYDRLGSGPLQLWIGALLAAGGVSLITLGALLRRKARRS